MTLFRLYATLLCVSAAFGQESAVCATCHRAIAESYARTGMGRSFRSVTGALPEFGGQTFRHEASDQHFVATNKGTKPQLLRYQKAPDGSVINSLEKAVDYVVGSGNHARTYLHRTPNGKLIELPLTWYSEKGAYWHMSPAYDRPDHSGFSREITYRCMFCHNSYPELPARADEWDSSEFPAALPQGIDCQRCHGPGRAHAESGGRDAILNPKRLDRDRQLEICMQCHLETTSSPLPAARLREGRGVFSYRPGEPLGNYAVHFDHAPGTGHDDKFEIVNAAYGMRKSACFLESATLTCTTCHDPHGAARSVTSACQGCHRGLSAAHPAATECVSCHMPKRRPSDVIHVEMTDHHIRAAPATLPPPAVEDNTFNNEPYRGNAVVYYPPGLSGTNLSSFDQGEALFLAGDPLRALALFESAPDSWRHRYAAAQAATAARQPDVALAHMQRARALAPREPKVLTGLADLLFGRGRRDEAIPVLRQSITIDPDMAESHHNLGNALGSQAEFAEAIRLRPEVAAFQMSLAGLFARQGNLPQARYHVEQAIRINVPRDQPNRGLQLAERYIILAALSDGRAAITALETATTLAPDLYDAHLKLGELLSGAPAREHLQKAAQSPNPAIRAAAAKLLMKKASQ